MPLVEFINVHGCADWDYGYRGPGWYYWDETWSFAHGPYQTKGECQEALEEYTRLLDAPC